MNDLGITKFKFYECISLFRVLNQTSPIVEWIMDAWKDCETRKVIKHSERQG